MRITLDGEAIEAREGDSVAAALLRTRITTFTRSIKYHRPRGPFCLAGSCGQCLLRVDGVPSLQACRVPAAEGMSCQRQNAPLGMETDALRAVDFLFGEGLDHHHLLTFSRTLGRVALEVARRLAGLGELPDAPLAPVPARMREAGVAIVGGGPAGLSAARGAVAAGARPLVLEKEREPGGAALLGIDPAGPDASWAGNEARSLASSGAEVLCGAEVVGLYSPGPGEGDGRALLAVRSAEGLTAVRADRVVIACGGVSQPLPFAGVDRPGVYAARGLVALAQRHGVLVGPPGGKLAPSLALGGEGRELLLCARALARAGYELAAVVDAAGAPSFSAPDLPLVRGRPLRARGNPVRELELERAKEGPRRRIRCDAVAIALPPAPLHELASGAGAQARYDERAGGFPVSAGVDGRTAVPWLFVAGRVAGRAGIDAVPSGAAAGRAAAADLAREPAHG